MAESSITVAVRIRPFSPSEQLKLAPTDVPAPFLGDGGLGASPVKQDQQPRKAGGGYLKSILNAVDDKVLIFDPPTASPLQRMYTGGTGAKKARDVRYAFDRVLGPETRQEEVFEETTKKLLDGVMKGWNASVFAYGATGCGKTHTISGSPEDPGVIFLTMRELFTRIDEQSSESEFSVSLSYLEIYNESIRDLLSPCPTPAGQGLLLREDSANKMSVVGITEHQPRDASEVLMMITDGNKRRTMSPTEANAVSSRSHAVLQINVTQRPRTAGITEETTSASLNIIDLAGSERASATRNNGARMKEGANINKSLLALGNCINALCQPGMVGSRGKHVPYRNSKLTRLLKFSLGGNCKTVMIVCVSPSSSHYDETHNTLKYANQAKNIRTKVTRNMMNVDRHVGEYVQAIHELKEEVAELKKKLEEKGSIENAREKRRREDLEKEVEEAKKKMKEHTANVRGVVAQKAPNEALLLGAEARLEPMRSRIRELESQLVEHQDGSKPADLQTELNILKTLTEKDEAIVNDSELKNGQNALQNSLQLQNAIIVAASQNTKFKDSTADAEDFSTAGSTLGARAASEVRILGSSLLHEVRASHSAARFEALTPTLSAQASNVRDLVHVVARCMAAMGEAAVRIDQAGGSEALSEISSSLKIVANANEEVFQAIITRNAGGSRFSSAQQVLAPARAYDSSSLTNSSISALRGPKNSLAQRPRSSVAATMGPPRAPVRSRRASVMSASGTSSPKRNRPGASAPPIHASSRLSHVASSPRRTNRRQSLVPNGPQAAGGMNAITTAAKGRGSTRRISGIGLPPPPPKKSFRWADETGEGSLDDHGKAFKNRATANSPPPASNRRNGIPPTTSRVTSSASDGRNAASSSSSSIQFNSSLGHPTESSDDSSLEHLPPPPKTTSRVEAIRAGAKSSNESDSSGTEWEDFIAEAPVISSTLSSARVDSLPPSVSQAPKSRRPSIRSSMFNKKFLSTKKGGEVDGLGSVDETAGSEEQGAEVGKGNGNFRRPAFKLNSTRRVASGSGPRPSVSSNGRGALPKSRSVSSPSSSSPPESQDDSSLSRSPFSEMKNSRSQPTFAVKHVPYEKSRPSAGGPVRRKSRASGGLSSSTSLHSSSDREPRVGSSFPRPSLSISSFMAPTASSSSRDVGAGKGSAPPSISTPRLAAGPPGHTAARKAGSNLPPNSFNPNHSRLSHQSINSSFTGSAANSSMQSIMRSTTPTFPPSGSNFNSSKAPWR